MKQYIKKSALVAEIKRRIEKNKAEIQRATHKHLEEYFEGYEDALVLFKEKFLDTLEVKKEPISEDLEEAASRYAKEEYNRKSPATLPDRCRGCYSPLMYAFKAGAEWQKEQMIDKACKWLKSYRQDTPDGTGYVAGIVNDKTIEEFKQAIEE